MGDLMTTALVPITASLETTAASSFEIVRAALREARTVDQVIDVRAKVEAAKAWAKVYKRTREMRLQLLTMEVEALVRIVELGGIDQLAMRERPAAEAFAAMGYEAREQLLKQSRSVTTAVGLHRALNVAEDLAVFRRKEQQRGRDWANHPETPTTRQQADRPDVQAVMQAMLDEYVEVGEPFTIAEMVEALVVSVDAADMDDDFKAGVQQICRLAVYRSPASEINGTKIPKFVTALAPGDEAGDRYVRIPTFTATVAHLHSSIDMRRNQLAADEAALQRFVEFVRQVENVPGATPASRVGDLVARSLNQNEQKETAA